MTMVSSVDQNLLAHNKAATSLVAAFDTEHEEMIHDAQLDYYGKKLATASSDCTIRIHEIDGENCRLIHTIKAHEGPVWQLSWSHPKFGNILASCSYDGKVNLWKEDNQNWTKVYEHSTHSASVNAIAFAPHEYGLYLACASSDGNVSILSWEDGIWSTKAEFTAHQAGCNSISWSPSSIPGSLTQATQLNRTLSPPKLVTGGSDNLVKIWSADESGKWMDQPTYVLDGHNDWVRDVAWAPNVGLPCSYIASCSQDKTVFIWTQEHPEDNWIRKPLKSDRFDETVWRLSWSISGAVLAVSGGDNHVSLWKQNIENSWELITDLEDSDVLYNAK